METSIRELPEMKAFCFEGYSPGPEVKAFSKMSCWMRQFNPEGRSYRVFGHNIDANGNLSYDPENAGYKLYVCGLDISREPEDIKSEIINPGIFAITRIEGSIENAGEWISEGWARVNRMIEEKQLKLKNNPRWFEEHLESPDPGYMMIDLYLELE